MTQATLSSIGVLAGFISLAACASAPEPTDRLVSAEAALRTANEIGANEYPQAKLHAKLAREELASAQKLLSDGEHEKAEHLLWRATADAELAIAMTRESQSRRAAEATGSPTAK